MTKPLAFIVEDDPLLGEIYSLTLQPEFDTETFNDGDVALVRLGQAVPAIVVLDLNLPTVSGKEVLKQIRQDKRLALTKVIIATADSNQASILSDQADIVILKPVSTTQLRELAARLLPV
jgi:DNA-binding response OmpR family regulator